MQLQNMQEKSSKDCQRQTNIDNKLDAISLAILMKYAK